MHLCERSTANWSYCVRDRYTPYETLPEIAIAAGLLSL